MMRFLITALVWWLMSGYGYGGDILAGPFATYNECVQKGMHLPMPVASHGWHCEGVMPIATLLNHVVAYYNLQT